MAATEEGGRSSPEPTIGERTVVRASGFPDCEKGFAEGSQKHS